MFKLSIIIHNFPLYHSNSALRIQKYLKYTCIVCGLIGMIFAGVIFTMKEEGIVEVTSAKGSGKVAAISE